MKRVTVIAVLLCVAGALSAFGQSKTEGTYNVYVRDAIVAVDKYEVIPSVRYADEIKAGDKTVEHEMLLESGNLLSYASTLNGLPGQAAKPKGTWLSFYDGTSTIGMLDNPEQIPFFEPESWSQFRMLLSVVYNNAKGGRQSFKAVTYAAQDFVPLEIERHGSDVLDVGGQTVNTAHYKVYLNKKRDTYNVWLDGDKLIAIWVPSKSTYVVDNSYAGLYEKIKQIVNKAS